MRGSNSASRDHRSVSEIREHLRTGGPALVALSGGVDSSLVAAFASDALGRDAIAVTLCGAAVSRVEVERARRVAAFLEIAHEVIEVDPLARQEYRSNPVNRCYFCRSVETGVLRAHGDRRGVRQYLDGIHWDDLADDRPGIRAMDEAGFAHPLVWAGWSKAEVRAAARGRGLPNWDEPSNSCLASRIAHGQTLSRDLLSRVEAAESFVHQLGFRRVRVRVDGRAARIEVDPEQVARLASEPTAGKVTAALGALGFGPITIDPEGYRHGPRALPTLP